jgi:selenocysteine lyase/cysteine desulfurase
MPLQPDRGVSDAKSPDWEEFRRQMPVVRRWAYLDHAAVAPLPEPAGAALVAWAHEATLHGDTSWPSWARQAEELRMLLASMISASPEEIALAHNTTEGISFVAEGFPWRPGDNVVTLADEFPSNQYPWMNLAQRGVETRRIATKEGAVDMDRLAAACDQRTRILAVSWVGYSSGWRNDLDQLAELAHRHGALLLVDAIQALGVVPLDVSRTPVDFLAADGHKWLLGPEGAGVFFIRREHLDRLRPFGIGWHSVVHDHDFTRIELALKPTAARYEGGSQNMVGAIALKASLELLARFGAAALCRRIFEITDLACQRLEQLGARIRSDRSPEHKSGIVIFDLPGREPVQLRKRCIESGVVLSCRGGGLRISPHAYNDASDIERLVEALQAAG